MNLIERYKDYFYYRDKAIVMTRCSGSKYHTGEILTLDVKDIGYPSFVDCNNNIVCYMYSSIDTECLYLFDLKYAAEFYATKMGPNNHTEWLLYYTRYINYERCYTDKILATALMSLKRGR